MLQSPYKQKVCDPRAIQWFDELMDKLIELQLRFT